MVGTFWNPTEMHETFGPTLIVIYGPIIVHGSVLTLT